MAGLSKILKNTKSPVADIELKAFALTIPAGGQLAVEEEEFPFLSRKDTVDELTPLINTGDITVNDTVVDLLAVDGIEYIKYPDVATSIRFRLNSLPTAKQFTQRVLQKAVEESFPLIKKDGVLISPTTQEIEFIGNHFNVTNPSTNKVRIQVGQDLILGRAFPIEFHNNGNTANKWLQHIPTSESTDQLPWHTPFDLEVFGLSYGNKNTLTDCDVQFFVNGTNTSNKVYTLQPRNTRYAHVTTLGTLFSMSIGDNLHIYVKRVGNKTPSSVDLEVYYRVSSNTVGSSGVL